MNIKDLIKDKFVYFTHYQNKELWYRSDDGFEFPVPIEDTGDGKFLREDKAIIFMRYIRKHMENITTAERESIYEQK